MYFCSQKLHSVYIKCLSYSILSTHKNLALHTHHCSNCCCSNTMLSGSCFSNDSRFSHSFCQKHLTYNIINLMGTCMIKIFSFKINLTSTKLLCKSFSIIETAWTSGIIIIEFCKLPVKFRVILILNISFFNFCNSIHKCFRYVLSTMNTKSSFRHFLSSCIFQLFYPYPYIHQFQYHCLYPGQMVHSSLPFGNCLY